MSTEELDDVQGPITHADLEEELERPDLKEEPEPEPEPQPDPSIEAEARKYGWRPQEEFRGDKSNWVPAERFMELPSTHVKQLRDQLKQRDADFEKRVQAIERTSRTAMQRALDQQRESYEAKMNAIRAEKRRAADMGEMDRYDQLERQEMDLAKKAPVVEPQDTPPNEPDPVVVEYQQRNEWIKNPLLLREAQIAVDYALGQGMVGSNAKAQLDYAEGVMREKYPHLFKAKDQPAPPRTQRVEGGSLAPQKKQLSRDLPPEAKAMARELIDMGVYKSVEAYAKDYFGEEQ